MRGSRLFVAFAVILLLSACEIEEELRIEPDGSGTYRAKVMVEKLLASMLGRIRAEGERDGFRIVEEGETADRRFVVFRKDFTDIRSLDGPQSNFDLTIETQHWFWREYRLHATLGSVAGSAFRRRLRITMPAQVTNTSVGESHGSVVTWYCTNGGTIDVVARGFYLPTKYVLVLAGGVAAAMFIGLVLMVLLFRRRGSSRMTTDEIVCRTCSKAISADARYCPSWGDVAAAR